MIGLYRKQHPNDVSGRDTKLPILAALSGVAVGALAALAVAVPTMQHNFALQTKDLQNKLALTGGFTEESPSPEAFVSPTECLQAGGAGGGEVLGASVVAPAALPVGGMGSGNVPSESNPSQPQEHEKFVKKLVSGTLVNASINNTGPYSANTVNTTVENKVNISNSNDIQVNNQTDQWAKSGSANVSTNTNAGSATSGAADNSSSNSLTISVNNNN